VIPVFSVEVKKSGKTKDNNKKPSHFWRDGFLKKKILFKSSF